MTDGWWNRRARRAEAAVSQSRFDAERAAKYEAWKSRLSSQDPRLCSEVDREPFDAPPEAAELRRAEQERRDRINGLHRLSPVSGDERRDAKTR